MKSGRSDPWELERQAARSAFRRRVRWWVDVPFGVGLVALAVLIGSIVSAGFGTLSGWADTALFLLLLPAVILMLLGIVILGGLVYLMTVVLGWLPGRGEPVRARLGVIADGARRGSDGLARVLILPTAIGSAVRAGWRRLWGGRMED